MRDFIFIIFAFSSQFCRSQVHPPPEIRIFFDSISIDKKDLFNNYELSTFAFKDGIQHQKGKFPEYLVNKFDNAVYVQIYNEYHVDSKWHRYYKSGSTIKLTLKNKSNQKSMNIYFRLCKPFMAGESIQINGFSFKQGNFFFDTYKSDSKYVIKKWKNITKRVIKIENFCDDSGQFIFDLSDFEDHRLSEKRLSRVLGLGNL